MRRGGAALTLLLVAAPGPAAAQHEPEPSGPYRELLRRYGAGEHAAAVAGLAAWSEPELRQERDALRRTRPYMEPERARLQAAIMLHTDRGGLELAQPLPIGDSSLCGPRLHSAFAESLVGLLLAKGQGEDFARRWYLVMALQSHGGLCLEDAVRWADAGLKWFPREPQLLLARGTAEEAAELFWAAPAVRLWTGARQLQRKVAAAAARRALLDRAQLSFEEALAASPDLDEARLRLARVRWRQGKSPEARAHLEALLARTTDPRLRHLGHLFLGRVHEDAGRLNDAEVQYRAAAQVDPASQVAAVALSHVLALAGSARTSREVLAAAVANAPRRRGDVFWFYRLGRAGHADGLFEGLRRETRH